MWANIGVVHLKIFCFPYFFMGSTTAFWDVEDCKIKSILNSIIKCGTCRANPTPPPTPPPKILKLYTKLHFAGPSIPIFQHFRWRLVIGELSAFLLASIPDNSLTHCVRWSLDSSPNCHTCFTSDTMLRFFTVVGTFISKRKNLPVRSLAFPAWVQLGSTLQRFVLIHLPPYITHSPTSPLSSLLHTYFVLPSIHKINKF